MSTPSIPAQPTQIQRITANCKLLWGAHLAFDFDIETDDHEYYACFVREDRGDSYGPLLLMTTSCLWKEGAWNELDRMLGCMAKAHRKGRPMTKEERLETFSGPKGEMRGVLEAFMRESERRGHMKW